MKLRPSRTMRSLSSQSWSRYSVKKPRKNYVKALPHTSLLIFRMGLNRNTYDTEFLLCSDQYIQLRSNALESARLVANRYLENELAQGFFMQILTYPHNVIREKKRATGAGADRLSQGMSMSFGKPVSIAARIKEGQPVILVRTMAGNKAHVREALRRAASKLSGTYSIVSKPIARAVEQKAAA